ncbi:Uncharacterized protein APZ42_021165 [Daphnia magna]|uniref:Uncharacterized protein n=1 Tax=Daphnia magna TaxID=35525 RepID=A0A164X148_9CRUS|nr:Uncharacterized protein APZ42_021165 [Daphnia magna]
MSWTSDRSHHPLTHSISVVSRPMPCSGERFLPFASSGIYAYKSAAVVHRPPLH